MDCVWMLLILAFCPEFGFSGNIKDTNTIRKLIFTNYSKDTLPVDDQSGSLYVNVTFYLRSIIELNEPRGELTTTIGLNLQWTDASLKWPGWDYGDQYVIRADKDDVWTPNMIVGNPGSSMGELLMEQGKVTIIYDGKVYLIGGNVVNTVCDIDVTYFPFDVQTCRIMLQTFDYGAQAKFMSARPDMDLSTFIENGVWSLVKTEVTVSDDEVTGVSTYATIVLKRREMFYMLNYLAPVLILVLLNTVVFILPAESGERIGFTVTILLSIAVYMTLISDKLPATSNPTSVLTYILVLYLLQSVFICIQTVASLRFYHRDDSKPVGSGWAACASCVRCKACKGERGGYYITDDVKEKSHDNGRHETNIPDNHCEKVSWTNVSKSLDRFFLFFNITLSCLVAVCYFVIVITHSKI